jgi:hypothetical protein
MDGQAADGVVGLAEGTRAELARFASALSAAGIPCWIRAPGGAAPPS